MKKITEFTFETLMESASQKIYDANRRDLADLRDRLEAIYTTDVNEFGLDDQHAVVECCLETYEHCAEMTCDTLCTFLNELVPWLEGHAAAHVQELLDESSS